MKKPAPIWVYLIGTIISFALIVVLAQDIVFPFISTNLNQDVLTSITKPEFTLKKNVNYLANMYINGEKISVDLLEDNSPENVNNFVYLSEKNYYDNTLFHRLIPETLIQGGDRNTLNSNPSDDGFGKTNYFIKDEVNWESLNLSAERTGQLEAKGYKSNPDVVSLPLAKYYIAMANSSPNTNSSQFFIVLGNQNLENLQGMFTVIGRITSGQDYIDTLSTKPVDDPSTNNPRPLEAIKIDKIEIIQETVRTL